VKREPPVHHQRKVMDRVLPWFFWRLCIECHREFVREPGWRNKWMDTPVSFQVDYVCAECCPTEPEAYHALTGRKP
jgi:hypothetical protein